MTAGNLLRTSLDFCLAHWQLLIPLALAGMLPITMLGLLEGSAALNMLVGFATLQVVQGALTMTALGLLSGRVFDPAGDLSRAINLCLPLIFVGITVGTLVAGGIFFLIFPGIYLIGALLLTTPLLMTEGGGLRAMMRSWDMTEGHRWQLFIAVSVAIVMMFVGSTLIYRFAQTLGVFDDVVVILDVIFGTLILTYSTALSVTAFSSLAPRLRQSTA